MRGGGGADGLCHLALIPPLMIGQNWRRRIPDEWDERGRSLAAVRPPSLLMCVRGRHGNKTGDRMKTSGSCGPDGSVRSFPHFTRISTPSRLRSLIRFPGFWSSPAEKLLLCNPTR